LLLPLYQYIQVCTEGIATSLNTLTAAIMQFLLSSSTTIVLIGIDTINIGTNTINTATIINIDIATNKIGTNSIKLFVTTPSSRINAELATPSCGLFFAELRMPTSELLVFPTELQT
jgi:hypothetical protein